MTTRRQRLRQPAPHAPNSAQVKHPSQAQSPPMQAADVENAPHPAPTASSADHAMVIQLQQRQGNAAVRRMLAARQPANANGQPTLQVVQRDPTVTAPPKAVPSVKTQIDEVYDLYDGLKDKLTTAQLHYSSAIRTALREDFEKRIKFHRLDPYMDGAGDPAQVLVETTRVKKAIEECEGILSKNYTEAFESWMSLQEEYADEEKRLKEMPDYVSEVALGILSKEYQKIEKRVTGVGSALVEEDLMELDQMFETESYLEQAQKQVEKEEESLATDYEDFTGEALPDGPSTLSLIWSVVGFDGPGDVLLTLLTGGTIKAIKIARKLRRARKLYKASKAVKKLATAKRLEKAANAAKVVGRFSKLLKANLIKDQVSWIKSNWSGVSRKIATDIAAAYQVDKFDKVGSIALGRIEKQYINSMVENLLKSSVDEERLYFQLALAALATGKTDAASRMMKAYIGMNGRRRLLTNVIFVALRKTAKLQFPVSSDALIEIMSSTAGEMAQDAVTAVPFMDVPVVREVVETERKVWQSHLQDFLKDAL